MAGWINSTGAGIGTGRGAGAGGRGFPNRRYTSDTSSAAGGSSGSAGSSRWRGDRSRGRPPPQPHYRYRPVDATHRHSSPSVGTEQETSSTSTHHAQMTHPANGKSPCSVGTVAPATSSKESDDTGSRSAANFECNVCFDMAEEPVVTKCGHLFCWGCLYQWLHVHSQARECPVCKGEVAQDAIIPIYGRGGSGAAVKNAPPRPTGARVESSRQQQQHYQTTIHDTVYVDDDEDDNPFDFPNIVDFGFGGRTSIREAMRSFMSPSFHDVDMDDQYEEYSYEFNPEDFEEVYNYSMMGFPVFPSAGTEAGNPSSSHMHADLINLTDSIIPVHQEEFSSYFGAPQSRNRRRHGRHRRTRASGEQSSTDAMVTGGSGTYYRDNSANSNGSVGASSRPNVGWVERRGRSNHNSNSTGGRGMNDGRRQRTDYN